MAKNKVRKLEIVYKKVDDLLPYENNAREHSPEQVDQLVDSMTEFDFYNPIKIHKKTILAGHGRLMAAKKKGMEEIPTIALDYLTKRQAQKLVLADNQLPMNATWNMQSLRAEIEDLMEAGEDIEVIGFDEIFLESLLDAQTSALDEFKEVEESTMAKLCPKCGYEFD